MNPTATFSSFYFLVNDLVSKLSFIVGINVGWRKVCCVAYSVQALHESNLQGARAISSSGIRAVGS